MSRINKAIKEHSDMIMSECLIDSITRNPSMVIDKDTKIVHVEGETMYINIKRASDE